MAREEQLELPAELAKVHLLLWIQSAVGPILLGIGFFLAVRGAGEAAAFAIIACTALWMLAFAPLRRKAQAIPLQARVPAPDAPRWVVRAVGIGQVVGSLSMLFSLWGALIVPASLFAALVLFVRIMACHGMDLPTQRPGWGTLVIILLFGALGNALVVAFVCIPMHF